MRLHLRTYFITVSTAHHQCVITSLINRKQETFIYFFFFVSVIPEPQLSSNQTREDSLLGAARGHQTATSAWWLIAWLFFQEQVCVYPPCSGATGCPTLNKLRPKSCMHRDLIFGSLVILSLLLTRRNDIFMYFGIRMFACVFKTQLFNFLSFFVLKKKNSILQLMVLTQWEEIEYDFISLRSTSSVLESRYY